MPSSKNEISSTVISYDFDQADFLRVHLSDGVSLH